MARPFWPTTTTGTFAIRVSGLAYVCIAGLGMLPALLQVFFNVAAYQTTPGFEEVPVWYTNYVAPLSSIGAFGLCIASGVLALVALIRGHDRGWGLYLALIPLFFVFFFWWANFSSHRLIKRIL